VTIVGETLAEPRSGNLEGLSDTVSIMAGEYSRQSRVVSQLIDISSTDYSTILHSINVMAFALAFASYNNYSQSEAKTLGLCGLLHDVGKTKIRHEILTAPRKLTDEEFEEIKTHTTVGYDILSQCEFNDKEISLCAFEHHERLDGSGYPDNKTEILPSSQIIGIIDCYEALTNDDRPYRNALEAFETLNRIIKKDVTKGKFDKVIYSQFVRALGGISQAVGSTTDRVVSSSRG
jgi:putative nucleotidyltransferase with HDIG domain